MQRRINEAEGQAAEIRALAEATALSLERLAAAATQPGGEEALRVQLVEQYLTQLSHLAKSDTQVVLPADLTRLEDLLTSVGLGAGFAVKQAP